MIPIRKKSSGIMKTCMIMATELPGCGVVGNIPSRKAILHPWLRIHHWLLLGSTNFEYQSDLNSELAFGQSNNYWRMQ